MTDPILRLEKNLEEVARLLDIHSRIAGSTPGRKHNVEVLNKSAIVLLVACWEAFIEDLCTTAFDFLLENAKTHQAFPDAVLTLASKPLKASPDNRAVWSIAGAGWRKVLVNHREAMLKEHVGKLNTPRPKQVDAMFEAMIGMPSLSSNWKWPGVKPEASAEKLSQLIELRGSIAHQVAAGRPVRKSLVSDYAAFIARISAISSNRVRSFIGRKARKYPWAGYEFGKTR